MRLCRYISCCIPLGSYFARAIGFCSVVFGWDLHDKTYENTEFSTADTGTRGPPPHGIPANHEICPIGYGDIIAVVQADKLRRLPWQNNIPFFMLDFALPTREPCPVCPRTLLRSVIAQYTELGYKPYSSAEFEFYCFDGALTCSIYLFS